MFDIIRNNREDSTALFIKHHYKYKVTLNNFGEFYILRMMNHEICICSKDPSADLERNDVKSVLVKVDVLILKPLTKKDIRNQTNPFGKRY